MSSQNALQLATAIQSKVGSSLLSVNSMLPKPEAAAATLQAGGGSLGVFLLRDLANLQEKTYECVEKVASILQSQLDLSEERERRERDQAAELAKEKQGGGFIGPMPAENNNSNANLDDIEESIKQGTFADLIGNGLTAALLVPSALKNLGLGLGKRLLKGGLFGAVAGVVSDPLIKYIDDEFNLELDQTAKDEIKLSMIGAGVGLGMAGIPGAIIGATAPMIAKVAGFITGTLNAEDVSDKNFAGTAIGGAAAAMFTAGKVGAYIKAGGLASLGAKASFGAALASLPVIIGVGAAVALGVGAMFIAKKIDEYQEMTLNKLEKTTAKLDKELGEWAAREEEGLFERMGINLGRLSAMGEAQVAAKEANEQAGQNIERFKADTSTQTKLGALVNSISNYSDDAIKTILLDRTKSENFFSTLENLKAVAAKGGFGDNSGAIFTTLSAMSDRVQNTAKSLLDQGIKDPDGMIAAAANNKAGKIRGMIQGGDQLENIPRLEAEKEKLMIERAKVEEKLAIEQKKLQEMKDAGMKGDYNFLSDNEFELQEKAVEALAEQLEYNRNNPQNLQNRINRLDRSLQKFGTTNGLLYNLDQLREIMSDDELSKLIKRSVNQQGGEFLNEQNKANKEGAIPPTVVIKKEGDKVSNVATQNNHLGKLSVYEDPIMQAAGYVYS